MFLDDLPKISKSLAKDNLFFDYIKFRYETDESLTFL